MFESVLRLDNHHSLYVLSRKYRKNSTVICKYTERKKKSHLKCRGCAFHEKIKERSAE